MGSSRRDCGTATPVCGNRICERNETPFNCQLDCGRCGDSICGQNESYLSCRQDCPFKGCGDGVCNNGESYFTCPQDCQCGPFPIGGPVPAPFCQFSCGNRICEPGLGENYMTCPLDCNVIGFCGNGVCEGNESQYCPQDCFPFGYCGDRICAPN